MNALRQTEANQRHNDRWCQCCQIISCLIHRWENITVQSKSFYSNNTFHSRSFSFFSFRPVFWYRDVKRLSISITKNVFEPNHLYPAFKATVYGYCVYIYIYKCIIHSLCIYVCVCITSNLSSYDHSLCRCSPALLRLGRDAKDVGRLRGQVGGGELTSIRAHLYCDELVGIPRIQTVSYLVSYKTVIRSSEVSLDPPHVYGETA